MDIALTVGSILSIIVIAWITYSIYKYETFDGSLIPKYPPPFMTERINRATSPGYPTYPAVQSYPI